MIVADELEADWKRVRVVQAPGDEERYGNQDTDGSRSTRHFFDPMRRCGAAARAMLEAAAAAQWKVPVSEVQAKNHEVVHGRPGRRLGYGALAKAAAQQPVPARETLAPEASLAVPLHRQGPAEAGRRPRHRDRQGAVRHRHAAPRHALRRHRAAAGVRGHGRELRRQRRAQGPGRRARRRDRGKRGPARVQSPGRRRRHRPRTPGPPCRAGRRCKIGWDDGPNADYDSVAFKATLEEAARKPGPVVRNDGNFDAGIAGAAKRLSAEYYIPHLAHATMEPPAAVARIAKGKCEVWGCFQSPQATRDLVAKRLGIPVGGRDRARHAARRRIRTQVEARLRRSRRRCCRRRWTASRSRSPGRARTTCITTYFHTVSVEHLEAGVDARGRPVAWLHRSVAPTIMSTFDARANAGGELGARDGRDQRPVRDPERPHREPGGDRPHAHRLVPLRVEHSPRVRGPVLRRRAGGGGGPGPEGLPAGRDRPGAVDQPADPEGHVEPRREPRALPRRHRPAAPRRGDGGARGEMGPGAAEGPRPGHRRALQLRDLRGGGRGGRRRRQGRPDDPASGYRGGLRRERQPRPRPRPDGRGVRDGRSASRRVGE